MCANIKIELLYHRGFVYSTIRRSLVHQQNGDCTCLEKLAKIITFLDQSSALSPKETVLNPALGQASKGRSMSPELVLIVCPGVIMKLVSSRTIAIHHLPLDHKKGVVPYSRPKLLNWI
jgi:hypothetical protein